MVKRKRRNSKKEGWEGEKGPTKREQRGEVFTL